jgi:hypothetical protein
VEDSIVLDNEAGTITLKFTGDIEELEDFVLTDYITIEPAGSSSGKKVKVYSKGEAVEDDGADVRVYMELVPKEVNEKGEYEYEIKLEAVVSMAPSGSVTLAVSPADKPELEPSMYPANLGTGPLAAQFSGGGTGGETIELYAMIEIANKETLASIKAGDDYFPLSEKYKQTADITISGTWTPIGTSTNPFTGSFDGGGYKIFPNITLETGNAVIFDYADKATFENIHIGEGSMKASNGNVAGIVYQAKDATFINCSNAATLEGTGNHAAGICGWAGPGSSFIDCWNTGAITVNGTSGSKQAGGICASVALSNTFGTPSPFTVENCYNSGSITGVTATNTLLVGGIIGALGGSNTYATIKNCYNTGTVTATGKTIHAGGITADAAGSADKSKIIACYNTGDVKVIGTRQGSDKFYMGGITGYNVSANVSITASYSTGDVINATTGDATASEVGIGGISGYTNATSTVVTAACYWAGDGPTKGVGIIKSSAPEGSDEGTVKFSDSWPTNDTHEDWGTKYWKPISNESYPKLAWEKD